MSNFTKGPWIFDYDNADDYSGGEWYVAGPAIVRFSYSAGDQERTEAEANARLICAAPDLLAALEGLMLWLENCDVSFMNDDNYMADHDNARAAITKALGAK